MIELLNSMGKSERSGSEFKLIYGDNSTSQYSRLTPTSAVDKIFSPISRFNTGGMVKKKNTAHNDYNGLF